jgi:hypothetical protein
MKYFPNILLEFSTLQMVWMLGNCCAYRTRDLFIQLHTYLAWNNYTDYLWCCDFYLVNHIIINVLWKYNFVHPIYKSILVYMHIIFKWRAMRSHNPLSIYQSWLDVLEFWLRALHCDVARQDVLSPSCGHPCLAPSDVVLNYRIVYCTASLGLQYQLLSVTGHRAKANNIYRCM